MSKARELADLASSRVVISDISIMPDAKPITNFVYGTVETPTDLPEGNVYIKVEAGVP